MPTDNTTIERPGRRERKKQATRRAIREAALDRALDLGVEHLTVTDITEAVDIAPRTFFNYFACKEDALVADGAGAADELRERLAARPPAEAPLDSLRAALTQSDSFIAVEAGREQALARQRLVEEHASLMSRQLVQLAVIEQALGEALAERLDDGTEGDLRPAMLAAITMGLLRVAIRRWSSDGSEPLVAVLSRVFDLLEQGALTDPIH